jgi:hypothetical protein
VRPIGDWSMSITSSKPSILDRLVVAWLDAHPVQPIGERLKTISFTSVDLPSLRRR